MNNQNPISIAGLSFLLLFSACKSNSEEGFEQFSLDGTNVSISDISGSWSASQALFFKQCPIGEDCPSEEIDIVQEGGSLTLVIQNDGRFSVTVNMPGEASETDSGRMAFDEDLLVISFDDDPEEWEFFAIMYNEPNLRIMGGTVYEAIDIDGDGMDDDADIDLIFARSS